MAKAWKAKLISHFARVPIRVYTQQELTSAISDIADEVGLPASFRPHRVIAVLLDSGRLGKVSILPDTFPTGAARRADEQSRTSYKSFPRFIWEDASPYEVALSLRKGSYLSHASAVFLHGLSSQIPGTIYVNKEQTPKPEPKGGLTQASIDRAFANSPRVSNFVFKFESTRIVLLAGKNTGNLEVSDIPGPGQRTYRATKLERTLIDIAVRPAYAGGVFEVLPAYKQAVERGFSIPTLAATLKRIGYVYPYHQAIGFYLENAGADPGSLDRLRDLGLAFDFYLTHRMPDKSYDPVWRIFYPTGLVDRRDLHS
jgi:hypothetical protein